MMVAPELAAIASLLRSQAIGAGRLDLGHTGPVVLRTSDDDGTRRLTNHPLRDRAEQPPLHDVPAVGTDDDRVGLEVRCELEDLAPRYPDGDVTRDPSAEPLPCPPRGRAHALARARHQIRELRKASVSSVSKTGLDHVQEVKLDVRERLPE